MCLCKFRPCAETEYPKVPGRISTATGKETLLEGICIDPRPTEELVSEPGRISSSDFCPWVGELGVGGWGSRTATGGCGEFSPAGEDRR